MCNSTSQDFHCEIEGCDRRFTTRFSLKRHLFIHSNTKSLVCRFCSKRFALP